MFRKLLVIGALVFLAACSRNEPEVAYSDSSVLGEELSRNAFALGQAAQDCSGYPSQAAAQAALRANPSDPNDLDPDDDGIACENNPGPYDRTPVNRQTSPPTTPTTLGSGVTTTTQPPTTVERTMAESGPRDVVGILSLFGVVAFAAGFALRGRRAAGLHWLD
jgi:hypothetical protein